jgi:2-desacetyl-2-hydroxyethyl bacteriochlorophyllide A dehydrogenase
MRAVRSHDHQISVVDVPEPTPASPDDGVVVTIAAAGICGSDLHMVDRYDMRVTLGHEFAGFLPDGRLVAVEPLHACRVCGPCRDGRPYHCERGGLQMYGTAFDGGMAERCVVPAETIVPLPSGVDARDASLVEPLAVTVHAVRMAGSLADASCVVLGGGTVGLCTVPSLQAVGVSRVDLVARHPHQREAAHRLGATVVEAERSRWDVVFDAVGTEQSLAQAVDMVKPGGRVVIIGIYWDGRVTMPGFAFCMKEVRLIASMVYGSDAHGRDADHAARILAARPELGPTLITHRFPLDAAAEAFACARDRLAGSIKVIIEP